MKFVNSGMVLIQEKGLLGDSMFDEYVSVSMELSKWVRRDFKHVL